MPNLTPIVFAAISTAVLISALYVVTTKNVVRAAYALLATMFGVAALYATLRADFLAVVQVIVYVGGINILIIFGVMLTEHVKYIPFKWVSVNVPAAAIISAGVMGLLIYSIKTTQWPVATGPALDPTTRQIGKAFLGEYLLPFEVASVLLLAVLIGSVAVGRKEVRED